MRSIYLLPNMLTTLNLLLGFYALILSIGFDFEKAAWAILLAAILDAFDGRVARWARAGSAFGGEYDSLCDLLSFAIAPSVLVYIWVLEPLALAGGAVAFCFVVCGAFRLARFNVGHAVVSENFFQGLPVPAAAAVIASTVLLIEQEGILTQKALFVLFVLLLLVLSFLMVSRFPFPSFKKMRIRKQKGHFLILLVLPLSALLWIQWPREVTFALSWVYVLGSFFWKWGFFKKSK